MTRYLLKRVFLVRSWPPGVRACDGHTCEHAMASSQVMGGGLKAPSRTRRENRQICRGQAIHVEDQANRMSRIEWGRVENRSWEQWCFCFVKLFNHA